MTDASLPDRVEAAARALAEDFGPLPWDDAPDADKHWRYLQAERVLAAADACEAERNPNTTDEYEPIEGWRIGHRPSNNPHPALDICDTDEPPCGLVFRRRPVSFEDVHREAEKT